MAGDSWWSARSVDRVSGGQLVATMFWSGTQWGDGCSGLGTSQIPAILDFFLPFF
ncbi:unnamed protein product [Cuscuta epithymum]|uniref:Uncharacterized protein n=1 Tax=Cuscuta epithymum TaxID=186058 RepID=A0AAV0EM59_9ASTE|nr:unnamed protein product [Cuscuta epithymum]